MDTPKRKRRRKRRQQSQPPQQALSSSIQPSHTADEDGGGPSTSTSSTKKKKARSSSWSPAKKRNGNSKGKEKDKEFLIAPQPQPQVPVASARLSLLPDDSAGGVVSSSKPVELLSVNGSSKKDEDGGRTPNNGSNVAEDVFGPVVTGPTNLSGKHGKKMGKKEREKERMRKDLMIGSSIGKVPVVEKVPSRGREIMYEEDDDNEGDNDENDEEEDDISHDDLSVEDNSSLNNLSLLQPPQSRRNLGHRKKGTDIAHIHSRAGIAGAYKSTPGSPKGRREFDDIFVDGENGGGHEHEHESLGDVDVEDNAGGSGGVPGVAPDESTGKKRTLSRRRKGLVRVRSVPQLDAEEPMHAADETIIAPGKSKSRKAKSRAVAAVAASISALVPIFNDNGGNGGVDLPDVDRPQTKRNRLIALAKQLRQFFPEQRQELRRVTVRLEMQSMEPRGKGKKAFLTSDALGVGGSTKLPAKSAPIPVPGIRKTKRNIHRRSGSESAIVDINDNSIEGGDAADRDGMPEVEEEDEDEELDPRGRPPKKGDVLIHVFIDQLSLLPSC